MRRRRGYANRRCLCVENRPMTRQPDTISFWRGALPHWEVVDGRYFVTVRLANSLPRPVADELVAMLSDASERDYLKRSRAFFGKMEQWLDRNMGEACLSRPEIAGIVQGAIEQYAELGHWHLLASVIMPNHIHLFLRRDDRSLRDLMRDFKRYTGRACNAKLGRAGSRFWQKEWFDHWSRSPQEDDKIVSYIFNNPERAGLTRSAGDWPWTPGRPAFSEGEARGADGLLLP